MSVLDLRARRRIRREAEAALDGLGDTVDQIAGSLLTLGVTGQRASSCDCPVANFLVRQLAEVEGAAVAEDEITLWAAGPTIVEVTTPRTIASFIHAFDGGHFDDLASPAGGGDRD